MELAVNRLADERDSVQKKTFTKWVNRHLNKAGLEAKDLFQDLRDGHKLLRLLEMFTGERLVPEKGRMRFHFMQNVACALKCLTRHQVKVVNIHPEHIVDGNPKITLGLIWTLILHFQISEVADSAAPESTLSAKESVLKWCQKVTAGYPGVKVVNFTTSWRDGMAFNAIIHRHRPELIDMPSLNPTNALENLENAFSVAETELDVFRLLDPEDVNVASPDEKSVLTYVASLWEVFPVLPEPPAEAPDAKWAEYTEIARELMEWMEMKIDILNDRFFPYSIPDMEILIDNFEKFKLEELPRKQEDMQILEQLWNELQILHTQSTIPFSPPEGLELETINETWKTMLRSKKDCEIALLAWLERLKRLMAIAEKLKENLEECESELTLLEARIDKGESEWPNMNPDESEKDTMDVQSALDAQATPIQDMKDNSGILVKESWPEGDYLSSRVQEMYVHWETLCTRLKLFINMKTSIVTLSLQTLQSVDEALQWIRQKRTYIEISQYGSDVDEVQQLSKNHWPEHQTIMDFRSRVRECHNLQSKFTAPCKGLTDLEAKLVDLNTEYQELLVASESRRDRLHYLFMYLSRCHSISEWIRNEYSMLSGFDWADMLIAMTKVDHDFEQLQSNMNTYRAKLEDCVKEHDNLLSADHPAGDVIKECMVNLQKKWEFILRIVECFTIQLAIYRQARQFFNTRQEIEQWLYEKINLLENVYQYENLNKEEADQRHSEITSLSEMVEREDRRVKVLKVQCEQLSPLELRRLTCRGKQERLPIKAVGSFEEYDVAKDDEGDVLELRSFTEWQVELKGKPAAVAPSLAFQLLPPSQRSRKDLERVENLFQRIRELLEWNFTTVEYVVEIIKILEEITVIESWQVDELFADDVDKRQAIVTQMNKRAKTLKPKIAKLRPLATDLDSYCLPEQVARANDHWDTLCCEHAEFEATRDLGQLSEKARTGIRELTDYLVLVDTVMVEQKRVAWHVPAAGQQESVIKAIAQDVASHASRYEEIRRWVSAIASKASEESDGLEKEMDTLKRHWETTAKEAHRRQTRIHKSIERLERYRDVAVPPFVEWLEGAEAHTKKIKKPGKSKEQLDRQIEEHKAFTALVSDKSSHLDSVIADGKGTMQITAEFDGLIQLFAARDAKLEPLPSPDQLSAYQVHIANEAERIAREDNVPSVNPEDYEPCSVINVHENNSRLSQRYKKLKERIERRAEELEEAVRYRKNFQSAMDSLVPWLEEREAEAETEIPNMIEPEAVMQKIEEVEMMENNIMERQPDVKGLQVVADTFMLSLGGQIRPIDNSSDEESDEDDIPDGNTQSAQSKPSEVSERVASMLAKLSARKALLQAALPKSRGFLVSCDAFEQWLTKVEAKLASSDPLSLEKEKLEAQLLEQRAVQFDVFQHKAILDSLNESGGQVITESPTEKPNVEPKLKSLTNRFNDVNDKSKSILTDMEKGLPLLEQFNKLYNEISESTHEIQDKQSSEPPVGIMEEILTQQADENEDQRKELDLTSGKVPVLETVGDQIVDLWTPLLMSRSMMMMNGDIYESSVDLPPLPELDVIHDKVEKSKQACKEVDGHAADRQAAIQEALMKVRSFNSLANEFENWMTEKENQAETFESLSADADHLNSQKSVVLDFLGDINDHKPIYVTVQDTGKHLVAERDPSDEVQAIQLRLDEIKERWDNLNGKAAHSKDSLDVVVDFREKYEPFVSWLAGEEEVVTIFEPVCLKMETLQEQRNKTEAIQDELSDHQPQYDALVAAGQAVLDLGEAVDRDEYEKQLHSVEERWDDVAVLIESRAENLQEATGRLEPIKEQYRELIDWISTANDSLGKLAPQCAQANEEDTKEKKETLMAFFAALADHEGTYDAVMEAGQQLIDDFSDADATPLEAQLDELHYQWNLLKGGECDRLLEVLFDWLERKEKQMADWQPVALNEEPISQQLSELESFHSDLLSYTDEVKIANEKCESLLPELSESDSEEPSPFKQQVDGLNGRWDQLNTSVSERQAALDEGMDKAKMFSAAKRKLVPWLEEAEARVSQMTETDGAEEIKEQQARVQEFNEEVAKQKPELEDVIEVGNSLVQGHSPEREDVKEVTSNIENWTERYNQLNQAIQSYWDNLMDQMSSATQFGDLYDAVVRWLAQALEEVRDYPHPALTTEGIDKQMEPLEDLEAAVNGKEHEIDSFVSKGNELAAQVKSPGEGSIQAKVDDVQSKWADLQSAVADLKATYVLFREKAEKYQTAYNNFDEYLTEQEEKVGSLPGIDVRPADVAQQIEEAKALQTNLQEHQPDMKEIEQLASDLCEGRSEDNPSKRYVNGSVASHHERFEALKERVDSHLAIAEDSLPKVEKYNKAFDDLNDWLTDFTEQVKNVEPVGLDPAKVQLQVADMNSLCYQLNSHKTEFDDINAAGNDVLAIGRPKDDPGAVAVMSELSEMQSQFNDNVKALKERQSVMSACLPLSQRYHPLVSDLEEWLTNTEETLSGFSDPPVDSSAIEAQLEQIEVIAKDIDDHERKLDEAKTVGQEFISCQLEDDPMNEEIQGQLHSLDEKFAALKASASEIAERLRDALEKAKKMSTDLDDVLQWIRERQNELENAELPNVQPEEVEKQIDEHLVFSVSVDKFEPKVIEVCDTTRHLLNQAGSGGKEFESSLAEVCDSWDSLKQSTGERQEKLDAGLAKAKHFKNMYNEMDNWLDEMEGEIDKIGKPAVQPDILQKQLETCNSLQDKVESQQPVLDSFHLSATDLTDERPDDDPGRSSIESTVQTVDERYNNLKVTLNEKSTALESSCGQAQKCDALWAELEPWLDEQKQRQSEISSIASETDKLKPQLEECNAVLVAFDECQPKMDEFAALSHDLLQSQSPEEETTVAFADRLQNANNVWGTLKGETEERKKTLEDAIVKAGQFEDTLHPLWTWLDEKETEVNGWEPIALDPAMLEQQLVDNETFNLGVSEHRPLLEAASSAASALTANRVEDDPSLSTVNDTVKSAEERFGKLEEAGVRRKEQLESMLAKSKAFHDGCDDLLGWLVVKADQIEGLEPVEGKSEAIKERIDELKDHQETLEEQRPNRDNAHAQLESLIGNRSTDDPSVTPVIAITAQVNRKFDEVAEMLEDKLQQLSDALPLTEKVNTECVAIQDWLNDAQECLSGMEPVPSAVPDIQDKLDELESLSSETANHQPQINEMGNDVKQLAVLLNESPEQTAAIQKESEELTTGYEALKNDINAKLKEYEAALSQAEGIRASVTDLVGKLKALEARLDAIEPYFVNVEKIKENVDEVQKIQNDLDSLQPLYESAVATMEEMRLPDSETDEETADLTSQWEEVKLKLEDMGEALEAGLSRAEDFQDRLNEVIQWIDKKLADLGGVGPVKATPDAVKEQLQEYKPVFKEIEVYRGDTQQFSSDVREFSARIPDDHPDREFIRHNLNTISYQYDKLEKSSSEHNETLTKGLTRAEKFQSAGSRLLLWMSSTQIDIDSVHCSIADPDTVKDAIEKAKAIQLDIDNHSNDLAVLCDQAKSLTSHLDDEEETKTVVLTKKQTVEDRYKGLQPVVRCRLNVWEEVLPKAEELKHHFVDMKQWLPVAEKALEEDSVTPSDPDTIRQQQETVEAVLADIEEHELDVESLNRLVNEIAAALPDDPDQVEKALTDVATINNTYKKLKAAAIAKRDALLEAKSKADGFQGVIGKLEQLLDEDEKTLAELTLPISLKVDEADAVVEKAKDLESQLAELEPQFESLATQAVVLKSVSSPEAAAAIDGKVDSVTDHYNQLQAQLAELLPQLSSGLEQVASFSSATDDLMKWLAKKEDALCTQFVLRAVPEGVQQQLEEHKLFDDEFEVKQPDLESLQSEGQDLKVKVAPEDAIMLEKSLNDVQRKWDDVTHHSSERKAELDDGLQQAQKFDVMWVDMMGNIRDKTQQIESMQPVGSDTSTVHNQMDELQDFQQSLEAIQNNVASLKVDGRHLIDACDKQDSPVIEERLAQLDSAWDALQSKTAARQRDIEDMAIKLGQFKDALADLLSWLTDTEGTLTSAKARPIGSDIKAIMVEIEKAEALSTEVENREPSVKAVNDVSAHIYESGDSAASELVKELGDVNSRYDAVKLAAAQALTALKDALSRTEQFDTDLQKMNDWMSGIKAKLNEDKPVGGVPDTCKEQLVDHEALCKDISDHEARLAGLNALAVDVKGQGNPEDVEAKQDKLNSHWASLHSKANDEQAKLDHALQTAEEFQQQHEAVSSQLGEFEQQLAECEPLATEVHHIKQQLEEHKEFQKHMQPHQQDIDALNESGLSIMKVCQPDDKIKVDDQLGDVNTRWDALTHQSIGRQQELEEALLAAGQFQEALDELLAWVSDKEASLDQAEGTTGDVEKLKLLLDKHKATEKTIAAREPNYEAVLRTGGVLVGQSEPQDAATLKESMDDLKSHWATMGDALAARQEKLEEALLHITEFQSSIGPLMDWIDKAQPTVASDQPVYGDARTVEELKAKHQVFVCELEEKQVAVDAVTAEGESLVNDVLDDGTDVEADVEHLASKWNQLREAAKAYGDELDNSLLMASAFEDPYNQLMAELDALEEEVDNEDPVADEDFGELKKQQSWHADFQRRVGGKQATVDGMISTGGKILRRCHPKSLRATQQKMKYLNDKWKYVCDKSVGRQQEIDAVLIKLRGLQQSIDEVATWLTGAEAQTGALEEKPIPNEQPELETMLTEMQTFQDRMTQHQSKMDALLKYVKTRRRRSSASITPVSQEHQVTIAGLHRRWQALWLRIAGRYQTLHDARDRKKVAQDFDLNLWKRRFFEWMDTKKVRVIDVFRKFDAENKGKISREEFVTGLTNMGFSAPIAELETVAEKFDIDGDGFVDYQELAARVRVQRTPSARYRPPKNEAERLDQEIHKVITNVSSENQFAFTRVADGKYKFGDSQKIFLVRILRSTVMVRVGGGWMELGEFFRYYDPAKATGRTNFDLRAMLREPRENVTGLHTMGARTKTQSTVASKNRQTLAAAASDKDAEVKTRQLPSGRRETVITKQKEVREGEMPEVVEGVEHSGRLGHSVKTRRHVGTTVTRTTVETVVKQPGIIRRTVTRDRPGSGTVEDTRVYHEKGSAITTKKTTTTRTEGSSAFPAEATVTTTRLASPTADIRLAEYEETDAGAVRKVEKKGTVTKTTKVTKISGAVPSTHVRRPTSTGAKLTVTTTTSGPAKKSGVVTPTKGSPTKSHIPVPSPGGPKSKDM